MCDIYTHKNNLKSKKLMNLKDEFMLTITRVNFI